MKTNRVFLKIIVLFAFIITLISCGKGETVTAPFEGEIIINPGSFEVADSNPVINWSDTYFTITVLDELAQPMNNTEIFIDFTWATPDAYSYVQLYAGDESSGYTAVNAPMKAVTDESGNYHLRIDFAHGLGLNYIGDLEIISGSVHGSASISIK